MCSALVFNVLPCLLIGQARIKVGYQDSYQVLMEAFVVQVCWSKDGDRVAACFSNKVISVLDLRM